MLETILLNGGIASHSYLTLLQAAAANTFPITPTAWFGVAFVIVLTVIMVAVVVYMLSGVINSQNARAWARLQIYEACVSILLLSIFAGITYLFFLNPQPIFGTTGLNIVPGPPGAFGGCQATTNFFTLSTCDLAEFNNATYAMGRDVFITTYLTSAVEGFGPEFKVDPIPLDDNINLNIKIPSILPSWTGQFLAWAYETIIAIALFNQIQLIVLSGSLFFLSFFVSLGLIARTLGFTRSFGGAMIAFGLGLGLLYPLLVSITYGYIDVTAGIGCLQSTPCSIGAIVAGLLGIVFNFATTLNGGVIPAAVGNFLTSFGYIVIGLVLVPFINLVIVDVFVIDLSSAMGERMSFMELFQNLI